ncbi:hypothetical protein HC031_19410 [Planosporangium thailandense]|uniref:Uncharacterized protein n=1 Tax=Planosporangium thailandense TaxID=765197 RepID=A0ABX0Y3G4_9ACTN|nr:hypothetical protein [Planosporangium thailandense]NJC71869.1 hypothetical protein [Planosporangium thailandense]
MTITGHDDLRTFYTWMMDRYVTTLHIPNIHVADVDTKSVTATGTGQAELERESRLLMAANRYDDAWGESYGR